jgi:hypothetical protein
MRKSFFLFSLFSVLGMVALFASCAGTVARKPGFEPVYLTDTAAYHLLTPDCIEKTMDMPQQISGRYGTNEFIMEVYVLADENSVTIVLYNSFGAEMARLLFDGRVVNFVSNYFPKSVKPEYIVADFQLVFYTMSELAGELRQGALDITETRTDTFETRRVLLGNEPIIEITKTPTEITYINHIRDYRYTLRGDFQ